MSPEVIEITFKRNRKSYFFNSNDLDLRIGQYVIVEVEKGIDLGRITQTGRLVMLKDIKDEPKIVLRKASSNDLEKMKEKHGQTAEISRDLAAPCSLTGGKLLPGLPVAPGAVQLASPEQFEIRDTDQRLVVVVSGEVCVSRTPVMTKTRASAAGTAHCKAVVRHCTTGLVPPRRLPI